VVVNHAQSRDQSKIKETLLTKQVDVLVLRRADHAPKNLLWKPEGRVPNAVECARLLLSVVETHYFA
jgi:hypothetical protein